MTALVAVDDFQFPFAQYPLQTGKDKAFFQRAGQFIINHKTTVLVKDDKQIHESFAHLNIG